MLQSYYSKTKSAIKYAGTTLLVFMVISGWAQGPLGDKIYLVNESSLENIDIVDLNKKTVTVRIQDGRELNFKAKEILMAFNESGDYLTFPNSSQQLRSFQSREENVAGADLIITAYGQIVPVEISHENGAEIIYHDLSSGEINRKVSTSLIAAIIYKEGNHQLFASPGKVSEILGQLEEKVSQARHKSYGKVETLNTEAVAASPTAIAGAEANEKDEATDSEAGSTPEDNKSFPELDYEAYSRKALEKTSELATYLTIISDRNNRLEEANKAVELAIQLFIDENAQFEVSSKAGKNRYQVRSYLNRLKLLKYDRIEISWTDISYVSDLKKGMDGNYYGVITLQQRFKGYIDNRLVYGDLTEKNIEVKVMAYQKESDGTQEQMWDLFLSDVGVVVTQFEE